MGKGMGRGGANLGKQVKGKSKERKQDKKSKAKENVTEKQLNEDIKMLEEYEKLNKLAEAQRVRLKKLQQQETYNTRINKKLLINIHRTFMRADKVDQLRKEIEILAQNHEREVDRKDAIIQMLTRDLDDAEEQFQTCQRNHMEKMNKFYELYLSKTRRLEDEFERDLKALKLEFNSERDMIMTRHARETKEMKGIIAAVEAQESERITDAKQAHETEREGIRNTNLEGINELRINLENKIEDLEKQFDDAHTNYVENTDGANKAFKDLEARDIVRSKNIDSKKRKIERMQANLAYWKKKIETSREECVERNALLREQKDAIAKHCNSLKTRMKKFRADEAKKLTELTVLAREALQHNQEKLATSEKILALAELGRKLETEREKVQPFYESTVKLDNQEAQTTKLSQLEEFQQQQKGTPVFSQAFDADGKPVNEWGFLENVHKKYNKVLLDKLAIVEEKKRLSKENEDLRSILKQYLDGIAITEDVVDIDNPLLIVNGKVNLLDQGRTVKRAGRPNTITEGTTVIRAQVAQGYAH
mmetsp:Transcript_1888/g.2482  ORF Transcript_1888/g.2482 Transcript_1888/m.2482 type:complete len:535 (-) Transcript_1888:219-1823(-)|eukprot:CAMPEP_0175097238 /NCGR_PEP_ID=MMETSP0086_2-20121207/5175_1 /TAXON_ID=136419 /ORGANISM="Unknown Unknown, Strain D1" /LENGTH=534 /DNA_ID=CAMNT_0016370725 /DNA_START=70 /DNA_END=1674 /DNA_ORIENTATION=+